MNSDVLIIGGGVIGLAIARELHKKAVRKITILERASAGKEASHAAAGMLGPHAETDNLDDFFFFCAESIKLYPNFAKELFDETNVDIELNRNGTLYLAFTETDVEKIRRRFEVQKNAGLQVEHLTAKETRRAEAFVSPDVLESLFFPNDWQVENRRLIQALQEFAKLNNIEIRENTEIKQLLIENGKITGAATVSEKFFAATVILAAGAWTSLITADNFSMPKVKPIRGQMIAFHTAKQLFEKVIYSPRGYLVPRADGRILAGASVEDVGFDKNTTASEIALLRENTFEIAPGLVNLKVVEKWAGLRPAAADGLPILGSVPPVENLFMATAHYRNGILLAPLTAKVLAEAIVDHENSAHLKIFGPHRFQLNNLRSLNIPV